MYIDQDQETYIYAPCQRVNKIVHYWFVLWLPSELKVYTITNTISIWKTS